MASGFWGRLGSSVGVAAALASSAVSAQEPPGGAERVFWVGSSPGEPSGAKRQVLTGLYGLSAVGLVSSGYFAYAWYGARQDVQAGTHAGDCFDLSSATCATLQEQRQRETELSFLTAVAASTSLALMLSGVLVAQYWDNTTVDVSVSPDAALLRVRTGF